MDGLVPWTDTNMPQTREPEGEGTDNIGRA